MIRQVDRAGGSFVIRGEAAFSLRFVKVSDCCGADWYAADGWPVCERCERTCVLVQP